MLVLTRSCKPGFLLRGILRAVPPKNLVPVIVTSENSASRVTSITHWPVLDSGVVIVLTNYIFCLSSSFLASRQVIEKSYPLARVRSCYPTSHS